MTVRREDTTLPFAGGLTAAGTGIDVTFSGVTLAKPLKIAFDVAGRPSPEDVAVVAHQQANGSWSLSPASFAGQQMTVLAQSFSLHMPAWLHPTRWLHWLGNRLASLIGGRTAPINCPGGGPAWASVVKQTDEAHTCLIPNADPVTHVLRAEVQIKSNRGTALEVDIPPGADYTWVQDQPWPVRSWVWAHLIHQDPNLMTLLPAGATLTAGYGQPAANELLYFQVRVSYWSLAYSLISDITDALSSLAADATGMATLYLMAKCSGALDYSSLSMHNPLSTVTFASAMRCVITQALSNLSSPEKAFGAAESLLGPGVDNADVAAASKELTDVGGKLEEFGWVVQLWPILQLGWGGLADVIHDLLTGGTSTLIDLNLNAATAACPTSAQLLEVWHLTPGNIARSWAAPSATITGFTDITCWDGWAAAVPVGQGNGWFVFSLQGPYLLSPAGLQKFTSAVCSSDSSPAEWKSTAAGPADCNP